MTEKDFKKVETPAAVSCGWCGGPLGPLPVGAEDDVERFCCMTCAKCADDADRNAPAQSDEPAPEKGTAGT